MKYCLKLITLSSLLFTLSLVAQNKPKRVKNFGENRGHIKMYSYVPANLDTSKPVPLVVILHGCSQSAKSVARATDWNKLADSLNFITLYPQQRRINNMSKCFNYFGSTANLMDL